MLEKVFDNNFDVKNVCKHKIQKLQKKVFLQQKNRFKSLLKPKQKKYQLCQQKEAISREALIVRSATSKLQKHYR